MSKRFSNNFSIKAHVVPDFYGTLVPLTGEFPTPAWDLRTHLAFMANNSISRGILSISSPGSAVYLGNEAYTVGIARLLNEWLAELVNVLPQRFEFFSVVPLPYINSSYDTLLNRCVSLLIFFSRLKESEYSFQELRARGVGLLTNHEGLYLGNTALRPFFESLNAKSQSTVIFIHPTLPVQRASSTLVVSNPSE